MSRFVSRVGKFTMAPGLAVMGLVLMVALAIPPLACNSDGTGGEPVCKNGIVDAAGNCVAKCDPAKCLEDNVCADNACRLLCTSHEECILGTQECAATVEDDTGRTVQVCAESGRQPALNGNGYPEGSYGTPCLFGDANCGDYQSACPNGLECNFGAQCEAGTCELDAAVCGEDPQCNVGRCSEGGQRCTFNTCTQEECTPFVCIGAGEGDADAYCSHRDCDDDSECPAGFYCGVTADPHSICGPTCNGSTCSGGPNDGGNCGDDGDCQVGNSNYCGTTTQGCIDPAGDNGGAQYVEGTLCLMRNTCLKREPCTPCSGNLDCSLGADVCQIHLGANVCARLCDSPDDCTPDEICVGYLAATGKLGTCGATPTVDCNVPEDCPTPGDTCSERSVCVPASGKCDASDAPGNKFCYHCVDDRDCGPPGSSMACVEVGGNMKGCFDLAFPDACTTDNDCPLSPSGLHGECLDQAEGLSPGDSVYHRCYFPYKNLTQKFSCY